MYINLKSPSQTEQEKKLSYFYEDETVKFDSEFRLKYNKRVQHFLNFRIGVRFTLKNF